MTAAGDKDYTLGLDDPVYGRFVAPLRALLDYDETAAQRLLGQLSLADLTHLLVAAQQLARTARAEQPRHYFEYDRGRR